MISPDLRFEFGRTDYREKEDEQFGERVPQQLPENISVVPHLNIQILLYHDPDTDAADT